MQAYITVFHNKIERIFYQLFPNNFFSRCLQVANISLLSFSEAPLFTNTVSVTYFLYPDTVSVMYFLYLDTVSVTYFLYPDTESVTYFLYPDTVSVNNLFQIYFSL